MHCGLCFTLLAMVTGGLEVQGHRGARARFPENTMAAFRYAADVGVDTLELDVGVTKDDVVVVSHDPLLSPTLCLGPKGQRLTAPVPLRRLTSKQVKSYDCGALPNPRFPDQKRIPGASIPTLEEVVAFAKERPKLRLNIETKIAPGEPELSPPPDRFAALVVGVLKRHDMIERSTVQSFDRRTLIAAKRLAPQLSIAQLTGENLPDLVAAAKAIGADTLSPNHRWITKEDVAALHAAGVRVIPWTANDERSWARLIDLGADGIITDDPEALIGYLKKRKLR